LRELLDKTTHAHEHNRPLPWHIADAPEKYVERMLARIVGFEIAIATIIGKWKLSQNKSADDLAGVMHDMESEANAQAAEVAEWMREQNRS
jgi:transcriptional regulator